MNSALIVATLAAAGVAQDEVVELPREIDVYVPAIEIRIPEIVLPKVAFDFDLALTGYEPLEIHIPELDFEGFDISVPGLYLSVPAIQTRWQRAWRHGPDDIEHDWTDAFVFDTDTTFEVNPNARLEIRNHAGTVRVRSWDRDAVRLEARHSQRDRVKVLQSPNAVRIRSESRHGPPDIVDYRLTIPASMAVDVWGVYTDVDADGLGNGIRVETLEGTVRVTGSRGEMSLRSVEGGITVSNSSGRLEANTVEELISLQGFDGRIFAESIDGDIHLQDVDSEEVDIKTVDGDIRYDGSIRSDGRYRLTTHDGDVVVAVPTGTHATVSVATFDGEFETDFEVRITRAEASRRFSFTIGDGSAQLELHAFDGDIQLVRR